MDSLDKFIKENVNKTQYDIPDSFNKKIDKVIAELPERNESSILKTNSKMKVIAATLTLCILGTIAINTPLVKAAVSNIVSYFNVKKDSAFIGDKAVVEKFNKAVGVSVKDKDIKVTLDNIVADDNFLMCYFTIEKENNIDEIKKSYDLIPFFQAKINNKDIDGLNSNIFESDNQESYFLNDKTLKVVIRKNISTIKVPNKFTLEIFTDEVFRTKGDWRLNTVIDKNDIAKETKIIYPNIKTSLNFGKYKRDIEITKVSISPLGNGININSTYETPSISFVLTDQNGNYLDILNAGSTDGLNSYEFLKAKKDMDYIDLIPFDSCNTKNIEVFTNITDIPITLQSNNQGKIIIENITLSKDKIIIKYKYDGIIIHYGDFTLADKNGKAIDLGNITSLYSVDRSKNIYTTTYILSNSQYDCSQVAQIRTFLHKVTLLNDNKIRIPLK